MSTATDKIKSLLNTCKLMARAEGYNERLDGPWEPTEADLDWITGELGRKPTAEEWQAAGLSWVGGDHTEVQS